MITSLLIANRGEIARRVIRTAAAMGISTVAVYAEGDAGAPYVTEADRAVALPGRSAAQTYLNIDALLIAAATAGADAVHPGYGFLSERAAFARAVTGAGLTWVGPPPDAIETMGDKLAAKRLMADVGVPVLPSWEVDGGALPDSGRLPWPLIVKAAAGGGGKGMRIVTEPGELAEAVAAARREAAAAFGDPTVFLERYLTGARHVEIQVLADTHGGAVHCFERECSIQRRHQKIIEECPSPAVDGELRDRMGTAALAAAKAVGYTGAGTVEFILEPAGEFWFLEMNTRLQVEHPVTEAVTGIDLVREQLLVARGLPLSVTQASLALDGHAIEARLYAEDPAAGFLPATGTLLDWAPAPPRRAAGTPASSLAAWSGSSSTRCWPRSSRTPRPGPRPRCAWPLPWNAAGSGGSSPTEIFSSRRCGTRSSSPAVPPQLLFSRTMFPWPGGPRQANCVRLRLARLSPHRRTRGRPQRYCEPCRAAGVTP